MKRKDTRYEEEPTSLLAKRGTLDGSGSSPSPLSARRSRRRCLLRGAPSGSIAGITGAEAALRPRMRRMRIDPSLPEAVPTRSSVQGHDDDCNSAVNTFNKNVYDKHANHNKYSTELNTFSKRTNPHSALLKVADHNRCIEVFAV